MRFRRVVVRRVGVVFVGASSGSAASPAITFDLDCSPALLTAGGAWGCVGTITNDGPQTATHLTIVEEIAGATLVASTFPDGTCTALDGGGISCAVGNLRAGGVIQFTTVFDGLPTTATVENTAYVSFDERSADGPDRGKQDTVCANAGAPPCGAADTTQLVAPGDVDDKAGGYVAFVDGQEDALATTGTPSAVGDVLTALEIPFRANFPVGFGATIVEATDPLEDSCPVGVSCFGQTVVEDLVGDFSVEEPVELTFRIIVPKGKTEKNIVVYHDGEPANSCVLTPLSETVDTCVDARSRNQKTKVVTIAVLSTDNGSWDFG
jgi:hypothetical protein